MRRAERADGHRPALPRGMDAVSDAGTDVQGVRRLGERRLPLLQLGRPVRHARPRRERADCHGYDIGCAARARSGQRRMGGHARAVSARLLQPGPRRPDSTIRTPAGRDAASGRASTPDRRSTSREARGRRARSSGSRSGRIRWRTDGPRPRERVQTVGEGWLGGKRSRRRRLSGWGPASQNAATRRSETQGRGAGDGPKRRASEAFGALGGLCVRDVQACDRDVYEKGAADGAEG